MKRVAACCGCSKNAARAAVHELERRSFIRRVPGYREDAGGRVRQTNNTYFILAMPDLYQAPVYPGTPSGGGEMYKQDA